MGKESGFLTGLLIYWRNSTAINCITGNDLLDVGCNNGELFQMISNKRKNVNYTGMDIVPILEKDKKFKFILGSIEDEKFAEENRTKFDCVTMIAVIEHLHNYDIAIKNCINLLKKGGRIIITTPTPPGDKAHKALSKLGGVSSFAAEDHQHIFTLEELKNLLTSNGFKIKQARHFQGIFNQLIVGEKP